MEKELSDGDFVSCLERAKILKSVSISRKKVLGTLRALDT